MVEGRTVMNVCCHSKGQSRISRAWMHDVRVLQSEHECMTSVYKQRMNAWRQSTTNRAWMHDVSVLQTEHECMTSEYYKQSMNTWRQCTTNRAWMHDVSVLQAEHECVTSVYYKQRMNAWCQWTTNSTYILVLRRRIFQQYFRENFAKMSSLKIEIFPKFCRNIQKFRQKLSFQNVIKNKIIGEHSICHFSTIF